MKASKRDRSRDGRRTVAELSRPLEVGSETFPKVARAPASLVVAHDDELHAGAAVAGWSSLGESL